MQTEILRKNQQCEAVRCGAGKQVVQTSLRAASERVNGWAAQKSTEILKIKKN